MMRNLRKSFVLFVLPLLLASCNKSNTLEVALGEFHTCQPVARVSLAFKTEREQPLGSKFNVYIGADKGFAEDYEKYCSENNINHGKFAIHRVVENGKEQKLNDEYIVLDDFPNDEKYPLTRETVKGKEDAYVVNYKGYYVDSFDFDSVDEIKGTISYSISYYDTADRKQIDLPFLAGESGGGMLHFEKKNDAVSFFK